MKLLSLDVECARAGNELIPIWIAVVNDRLEVLLDSYVKPSCKISSWLSNLHGVEEKHVETAPPIEHVLTELRKILSSDCILVGQSIASDVAYLNLKKGIDFAECVDVALFFALTPSDSIGDCDTSQITPTNQQDGYNFFRSPRRFTLEQSVKYLLSESFCAHNPVEDAKYAMRLYLKYKDSPELREEAKAILIASIYPRKTDLNPGKSKNNLQKHNSVVSNPPSNSKSNQLPTEKKGYSRTRPQKVPLTTKIPTVQPFPLSPQKVVSFVGKLETLVSRIKLIGRPSVNHLFMVQSPEALLMQRSNSLESVNYFNYIKVQDHILMNQGFWRGAFQGNASSIDYAINSLRFAASNQKNTLSVVAITFQLFPLESFLFYEEDKDLIVTVHSIPDSEVIFMERVNKILLQHPELKLSKSSKEQTNGIEFEKWLDIIETKMKLNESKNLLEKPKEMKMYPIGVENGQQNFVPRKTNNMSMFLESHVTKIPPSFPQYLPFPVPPMGALPFMMPPMPLPLNNVQPLPLFVQGMPPMIPPPFLVQPLRNHFS